ncbi:MAG: hypothetical protein H6673_05045 [Anaerolineales bacterium]|nr:hypothetical protein [Anaerolineales bacterium]
MRYNVAMRKQIIWLWLGWYIILILFQHMVWVRFHIQRPDYGYSWTADYTTEAVDGPSTGAWFHARWDSWRYVEIAQHGYSDIKLATFFPGYPILIRLTDELALRWLFPTANPQDRMALAGVVTSALMGGLAALLLGQFIQERLGENDALRGVFYLLIFPTALFMAQVYTESTYLAVSLGALLLTYRKRLWLAGAVAAYAALTRPTGVLLFIPIGTVWLDHWWRGENLRWDSLLAAGLPIAAFFGFNTWLGSQGLNTFEAQEDFGRYFLHPLALCIFVQQFGWMFTDPAGLVTVGLDIALTLFATALSIREWKWHPGLALYGLAAIWLPLGTGQLVSQNRYVLIVVPMLLVLTRWGRHAVFDRIWTILSLVLFALYTMLYTQGFWAG